MLRLWRGVEPYEEVVAGVMFGLEFLCGLREEICAPVRDAPNDALLL